MPTAAKTFAADLAKMNATLTDLGALVTTPDGFTFINSELAPTSLLRAFQGLTQYGYANGLI
jgi:hypothetical protein